MTMYNNKVMHNNCFHYIFFFKRFYLFIFREKGREGREGEKHWYKRYINQLPLTCPPTRTWLAMPACALIGNQTRDLLVCRPSFNPLSHTSQNFIKFSLPSSCCCSCLIPSPLGYCNIFRIIAFNSIFKPLLQSPSQPPDLTCHLHA